MNKSRSNVMFKNRDEIYHKRARKLLVTIAFSIAVLCVLLLLLLHESAKDDQDSRNERFFSTTFANLQSNETEMNNLSESYNETNRILLSDFMISYGSNNFKTLFSLSNSKQREMLNNAATIIDNCKWIAAVDEQGNVLTSSSSFGNYLNIIDESWLSEQQFNNIINNKEDSIIINNPDYDENNDTSVTYDIIQSDESNYGRNLYVYGSKIPLSGYSDGNCYIIMSFGSKMVDEAHERLSDLGYWINTSSIGVNGTAVVVSSKDKKILYGSINSTDYSGLSLADTGLSDSILLDNTKGMQTIDGKKYYCYCRSYSSTLFNDDVYIISFIPRNSLYGGIAPVMIWTISLLFIVIFLIVSYSAFLRYGIIKNKEDLDTIRFVLIKKRKIYYSKVLGKKIIPVMLAITFVVFGASFYIQALLRLSDAFLESVSVENEITKNIYDAQQLQSEFVDYYDTQNLSKAKLVAYILNMHCDTYFDINREADKVNQYADSSTVGTDNLKYVKDFYGNTAFVIQDSSSLKKLVDLNDLSNIFVFGDNAHLIASSSNLWDFQLSENEEDQSYKFREILNGNTDTYCQEARMSDIGEFKQYIGSFFNYYTCLDEEGNTEYVNYSSYKSQIDGSWTGNEITKHRGVVQIEVNPFDVYNIIESSEPDYVLANTKISNDGFLILFANNYPDAANINEQYAVLYSPYDSMQFKTAAELGISNNAFNGEYNGFQKIKDVLYLQSIRQSGSYYIATAIPVNKLYESCFDLSIFCSVFYLAIMFILSSYTLFFEDIDGEEIYREGIDPFAIFGHWSNSKKWQKTSVSQKFEALIKDCMIILSFIFLLAIFYQQRNFGDESAISYILSGNWDRGIHIFSISLCIVIIIFASIIIRAFVHVLLLIAATFGNRTETIMHLITSLLKAISYVSVGFYCLYIIGIDARNLLASAGILTVVLGFGAQNITADLLAGVFIVMEGSIHVGDYIEIDDFRGKITEIGLRTTKFEDTKQNIKIMCNSEMKSLVNMSKKYTFIEMDVPVPYGEDTEKIKSILNDEFVQLYSEYKFLKGIPVCQGIQNFSESSLDIRVRILCDENDRMDVNRFMHDQIVRIFNENNIEIPFNQLDVHFDSEFTS